MIHPLDTRKGSVITHVAHTMVRQKPLTCCGDVPPLSLNAWLTVCVPVRLTGGEDEVEVRTVQPSPVHPHDVFTDLQICTLLQKVSFDPYCLIPLYTSRGNNQITQNVKKSEIKSVPTLMAIVRTHIFRHSPQKPPEEELGSC